MHVCVLYVFMCVCVCVYLCVYVLYVCMCVTGRLLNNNQLTSPDGSIPSVLAMLRSCIHVGSVMDHVSLAFEARCAGCSVTGMEYVWPSGHAMYRASLSATDMHALF